MNTAEHRVHGTDLTLGHLSWMAKDIAELAQANVVVIHKEDIPALDIMDEEFHDLPGEEQLRVIADGLTQLKDIFLQAGLPQEQHELFLNSETSSLRPLLELVWMELPAANGIDVDGDNINDVGMIVAPAKDITPAEALSMLSGVGDKIITHAPGDGEDAYFSIMAHEGTHISQSNDYTVGFDPDTGMPIRAYEKYPLPFEIDADIGATKAYSAAVAEGRPLDPEFAEAFESARVVGSLGSTIGITEYAAAIMEGDYGNALSRMLPSHATHIGLEHEGALPMASNEAGLAYNDMLVMNTLVNMVMGQVKIQQMMSEQTFDENGDLSQLSGDAAELFETPWDMIMALSSPMELARVGHEFASVDVTEAYTVVKVLEDKGWFMSDGAEGLRDYVTKLDNFFDNYAQGVRDGSVFQKDYAQYSAVIPGFEEMYDPDAINQKESQFEPGAEADHNWIMELPANKT